MCKKSIVAGLCALLISLGACQEGPGTEPATDGEAPTYSTRIFKVRSSDFAIQGLPRGVAAFAGIEYSMPEITREAIEQGIVQAHVESPLSPDVWLALPFSVSLTVSGFDVSVFLSYAFSAGKASLTVTGNVTAAEMAALLGAYDGYRFRVVVGQP